MVKLFFFFWDSSLGKFHMILASSDSLAAMGTWGSRVSNVHLRHVASRAISWCRNTHAHVCEKSYFEGEREQVRERRIWRKIDKGREGWNTHGPSGTVLYFKPWLWKNRAAAGQSITALACSYKAASLCGQPPTIQLDVWEEHQDLPLEGALACICNIC